MVRNSKFILIIGPFNGFSMLKILAHTLYGRLNHNADALSRIQSIQGKNETYQDFLKEFQHKVIKNNNIEEISGTICDKLTTNICLPISCDLECKEDFQKEAKEKLKHFALIKPRDVDVNIIIFQKHNEHFVYYICTKQYYWDRADYQNYFETIIK